MKAEMRQVLSGNGLCNESFGYLRKKPICNESGQQILNSSRMCCCEMCVPRGEKKNHPTLDRKAAAYSDLFPDVRVSHQLPGLWFHPSKFWPLRASVIYAICR